MYWLLILKVKLGGRLSNNGLNFAFNLIYIKLLNNAIDLKKSIALFNFHIFIQINIMLSLTGFNITNNTLIIVKYIILLFFNDANNRC